MGRGSKIGVGVVVVLAILLGLNALVTGREAESAEVTVPGGRIAKLPAGDLQVIDRGPRDAAPIVLVHCFTCALDWWDRMLPLLERGHRVVAVDLLGHGGSEKPDSGYEIETQADLVAGALARLGVRDATVVGHSLGGTVSVALAERSPGLVDRIAILDTRATHEEGDLGLVARLGFTPIVGEAGWRLKTDSLVREGLEVAFAPGFDFPDAFVADVNRMTYSAYDESAAASGDYVEELGLDERTARIGKPLLVIMGAEEQIIDDPAAALREYREAVPGARTRLMPRVGHSPNVEAPAKTAALVLAFAAAGSRPSDARDGIGDEKPANRGKDNGDVQGQLQKSEGVRRRP